VITPHYHAVRSWRVAPDELDRRLILLPLFPSVRYPMLLTVAGSGLFPDAPENRILAGLS
jgi:hypothetical protein